LEAHQGMSAQTPTGIGLSTNSSNTSIPTTPLRTHQRGSEQTITNRTSGSSSSNYPQPQNSDMVRRFLTFSNAIFFFVCLFS
jgi:hypothetical protein